jgi:8-oxo-dGTP pyrophosphatase MutT (NUDIX family)
MLSSRTCELVPPRTTGQRGVCQLKEISAGGVVYRRTANGVEILLVEDRYAHWTLPKGKQEPGETHEETALREIEEETGIRGRIEQPLESVSYTYFHPDKGNVQKEVHYYLVQAETDQAVPQLSEINTVRWLSAEEAWKLHEREGYDNNRSVLKKAFQCLGIVV